MTAWLMFGAIVVGTVLGVVVARLWVRRHPYDRHRVNPRCLQRGHKWHRIADELPIQFCRRHYCNGARVAPAAVQGLPPGLVAALRATLAEEAVLSLDEAP